VPRIERAGWGGRIRTSVWRNQNPITWAARPRRQRYVGTDLVISLAFPTYADVVTICGADMDDERVSMQAKITKRVIDAALKESATYLVRDGEVKGFVLVATPAGAKFQCGRLPSRLRPRRAEAAADDRQARLAMDTRDGADRNKAAARRGRGRARSGHGAAGRSQTADLRRADRPSTGARAPATRRPRLLRPLGRIEHHLRPMLAKLRADRIGRPEIERMRNAVAAGKTAEKVTIAEKRRPGSVATGGNGAAAMRRAGQFDLRLRDGARAVIISRQSGARRQEGAGAQGRAYSVGSRNRPAGQRA
jgi:hypothetical protein